MAADFYELTLSGILQETPDARSFLFEIPAELRETFAYKAGQFCTFEIPWDTMMIRRSYSLASAPETDAWHKVTVKRVVDGRVSNWFNDTLHVGSVVRVQPPEGRFVLSSRALSSRALSSKDNAADEDATGTEPQMLTLFGGGSGITPVISLMKSALATTPHHVRLVYANRDAASVIFKQELDLIVAAYPKRAEVIYHLDSESGYMTREKLQTLLAGRESSEHYVCGPGPFMDTVEQAFSAANIDASRTHFERFVSPLDPDRRTESPALSQLDVDVDDLPTQFVMHLDGQRHEVAYRPGLTLLKAAEDAGVKPPSSCEDGYCGCCMAKMKTGSVTMPQHEALTDDDLKKGWILPCQAKPDCADPIEIDFDAPY